MPKRFSYSPYYTHTLAKLELDVIKRLIDDRAALNRELLKDYETNQPRGSEAFAARIKFELTVLNALTESMRLALAEASDGGRVELRISRRTRRAS